MNDLHFSIQPVQGANYSFPPDSDCSIFQPDNMPSQILNGYDVCHIMVGNCILSFSCEPSGIVIGFEEGGISEAGALEIVIAIAKKIANVTGQGAQLLEENLVIVPYFRAN